MIKANNVDQETIKDSNKKKILNILRQRRELTKQDISRETGISIPTVTNNINELIAEGLVEEAGVTDSTGGRKPMVLKFLPNSKYSFGVDFSYDEIRVILTNLDLEILKEYVIKRSQTANIDDSIAEVSNLIKQIIDDNKIDLQNVMGIGFSLPGTVNEEIMILEMAPNLGIRNLCLKDFQKYFDFPLYIENEANAAAYAELTLGIAKQMRNLAYISITQGIGAGIVIQDHLYKGKNKRAGEFGHMTIVTDGKQCRCGKKGCWEVYASDKALIEDYNSKAKEKVDSLKEFFYLLKKQEPIARKVWNQYLKYLAAGIQNIILILDPHYIVIGGEISRFGDFLLNPLKEKVFIENNFYGEKDVKIYLSRFQRDSSILGAALLPLQKLFYLTENII